jgi:nitrogen fixation/metabolism regulation signal transduction histidine kinase
VRAGGFDGLVTVPQTLRRRESERQIAELDRRVLFASVLFVLLGAGLGYWMAERIADPVNRLTRATRRIASGELDARVAATSSDELRRLVDDFNRMADDLQRQRSELERTQRLEAWADMARQVAHEIKNPLTPIQLSAQRIRRRFRSRILQPEDAKVFDECVDTISSQVETLKVLVNEFSNFARLPAADPKPGDLNRLVEEALASYAGTEAVRFHADLDPKLPVVEFDREQMRRVLTNLIDNAIAAVRQRIARDGEAGGAGRIEVRTVHDAPLETARIEVGDDGVGIRPDDRRRVFEPYFSTKDHGTGLGLAIVSRIVADHHGYVRVHANRPRGTRFIVELPLRQG